MTPFDEEFVIADGGAGQEEADRKLEAMLRQAFGSGSEHLNEEAEEAQQQQEQQQQVQQEGQELQQEQEQNLSHYGELPPPWGDQQQRKRLHHQSLQVDGSHRSKRQQLEPTMQGKHPSESCAGKLSDAVEAAQREAAEGVEEAADEAAKEEEETVKDEMSEEEDKAATKHHVANALAARRTVLEGARQRNFKHSIGPVSEVEYIMAGSRVVVARHLQDEIMAMIDDHWRHTEQGKHIVQKARDKVAAVAQSKQHGSIEASRPLPWDCGTLPSHYHRITIALPSHYHRITIALPSRW